MTEPTPEDPGTVAEVTASTLAAPDVNVGELDDEALAELAAQAAAEQAKREQAAALDASLENALNTMDALGIDPDAKWAQAKETHAANAAEALARAASVLPPEETDDPTLNTGILAGQGAADDDEAAAAAIASKSAGAVDDATGGIL